MLRPVFKALGTLVNSPALSNGQLPALPQGSDLSLSPGTTHPGTLTQTTHSMAGAASTETLQTEPTRTVIDGQVCSCPVMDNPVGEGVAGPRGCGVWGVDDALRGPDGLRVEGEGMAPTRASKCPAPPHPQASQPPRGDSQAVDAQYILVE